MFKVSSIAISSPTTSFDTTSGPQIERSDLLSQLRGKRQDGKIELPDIQLEKIDPSYAIPFLAEEGAVQGRKPQPRHPISGMMYFGPHGKSPGDLQAQRSIDDLRKSGYSLALVATYKIGANNQVEITGWKLEATRKSKGPDGKDRTETFSQEVQLGDPPRSKPDHNEVPSQQDTKIAIEKLRSKIAKADHSKN